jgi:hypothetical protein
MPAIQGAFFGLPVTQLLELRDAYVTAISRIAQGQSYVIDGRQLTRVDLGAAQNTLREINAAIAQAQGTRRTVSYGLFRSGYSR